MNSLNILCIQPSPNMFSKQSTKHVQKRGSMTSDHKLGWYLLHRKSAKLPWHYNIKLSFWSLPFCLFGFYLFVCLYLSLFVFLSFFPCVFLSFDQISEESQVSKVTLCVKILKWRSVTQWPRVESCQGLPQSRSYSTLGRGACGRSPAEPLIKRLAFWMARAAKTKEMQQTNKEAKAEGLKATKIPSQMVNSSVKGTWKKKKKFRQRKRFKKKNKQKTFGSLGVCQKYVLVWHCSFDDDVFFPVRHKSFSFPNNF